MPPKRKTTVKKKVNKKAKRNLFDFFSDASRDRSAVGTRFLEEVNKEGATARKLYNLLVQWGYEDVRLEDFTKVFNAYKAEPGHVKDGVLTMGY
jgi:hypothetical protein